MVSTAVRRHHSPNRCKTELVRAIWPGTPNGHSAEPLIGRAVVDPPPRNAWSKFMSMRDARGVPGAGIGSVYHCVIACQTLGRNSRRRDRGKYKKGKKLSLRQQMYAEIAGRQTSARRPWCRGAVLALSGKGFDAFSQMQWSYLADMPSCWPMNRINTGSAQTRTNEIGPVVAEPFLGWGEYLACLSLARILLSVAGMCTSIISGVRFFSPMWL
jgi:hypothetical protein